jgi:hypothetical protein
MPLHSLLLLTSPSYNNDMSQRKQEKDYSPEVKALEPEVEALSKVSYTTTFA